MTKEYNPANYERAKVEDYGFKEHKVLKMTWKIISKVLLVFSIFMLYFSIIIIAIQSVNSSESTTEFAHFSLEWYAKMFTKTSLTESILNTFYTSICATAIATVLGTLVAIGLFYLPTKTRQRITLLNNIPLLNADIVTGISIMLIFSMLTFIPGLKTIFGFWTILIAHIYFILPYIILSVLPKMKEMDANIMDASLDLGVRPFKSIIKVILPSVKGGIFSGLILAFTISFEDFVVGYFTTGNGYKTLSIWIYTSVGKKSLFPGVYAFSTTLTLVTIAAVILYNLIKGRIEHDKKNK